MKKIKILFIFMTILLPLQVKAMNGSINIKCDSNDLKKGESTVCKITGYSNEEVAGLTIKLKPSSSIEIDNIVTSSIWEGNGDYNFIALYTDENKTGNFEIATFEVKKVSNGKSYVDLSEIVFVNKNFEENTLKNTKLYLFKSVVNIKIWLIILLLIVLVGLVLFKNKKKEK